MIRRLLKGAKGYEAASIFTLLLVLFETALEVILPMFMSYILNTLQLFANGEVMKDALTYLDWSNGQIVTIAANSFTLITENILKNTVLTYGVLMIISAVLSLSAGAVAGRLCAVAGAGFSKNMRSYLFAKIQDFSFSNVDKFSTASLVTRSTTDVNNAQQSFMMLIRTVIRAPGNDDFFLCNGVHTASRHGVGISGCSTSAGRGYVCPFHKGVSAFPLHAEKVRQNERRRAGKPGGNTCRQGFRA